MAGHFLDAGSISTDSQGHQSQRGVAMAMLLSSASDAVTGGTEPFAAFRGIAINSDMDVKSRQ